MDRIMYTSIHPFTQLCPRDGHGICGMSVKEGDSSCREWDNYIYWQIEHILHSYTSRIIINTQ